MLYYQKQDIVNSKKYLDKAKSAEPRLNKGMEGIAELEKDDFSYSEKQKKNLKKCLKISALNPQLIHFQLNRIALTGLILVTI